VFDLLKKIKHNQFGTLIINLVVSIGVIVLLMTISLPYLRRYQPNMKLSAESRSLVADLRYAQQLTVTEQAVHTVDFNLGGDSYQIIKTGVASTTVKTVEFDPEVSFQQITGLTDNRVVFNYYGGVSQSGQVVLINTNFKTTTINIKPSGYIQLE